MGIRSGSVGPISSGVVARGGAVITRNGLTWSIGPGKGLRLKAKGLVSGSWP